MIRFSIFFYITVYTFFKLQRVCDTNGYNSVFIDLVKIVPKTMSTEPIKKMAMLIPSFLHDNTNIQYIKAEYIKDFTITITNDNLFLFSLPNFSTTMIQ